MIHYRHEVEVIEITREEFDDLREMQEQNPPFRFSCDPQRVWLSIKQGYDQPEDRAPHYVDHHILNRITRIVRRKNWRGKQFRVRRAGAFLCDGDEQIAEFNFLD